MLINKIKMIMICLQPREYTLHKASLVILLQMHWDLKTQALDPTMREKMGFLTLLGLSTTITLKQIQLIDRY